MEKNLFIATAKYDGEKLIFFEINQFVCQNVSYRQATTKIFAYHFSVPRNQSVWPIKEFFFSEKVFSSDSDWRFKGKSFAEKDVWYSKKKRYGHFVNISIQCRSNSRTGTKNFVVEDCFVIENCYWLVSEEVLPIILKINSVDY